jgi:hypothetical protein
MPISEKSLFRPDATGCWNAGECMGLATLLIEAKLSYLVSVQKRGFCARARREEDEKAERTHGT